MCVGCGLRGGGGCMCVSVWGCVDGGVHGCVYDDGYV